MRVRYWFLVLVAVTIAFVLFVPIVSIPGSTYTVCGGGRCSVGSQYGSLTYVFFGTGAVYDTHGSYWLGSAARAVVSQPDPLQNSSVSAQGLQLRIDLNLTGSQVRGVLHPSVGIFNTLTHNVTILMGSVNGTLLDWNKYDFACEFNPSYSLVGFAVFKGTWSAGNLSSAPAPLLLVPSVPIGCIATLPPSAVTFWPMSDGTTIYFGNLTTRSPNHSQLPAVVYPSTLTCSVDASQAASCGRGHGLFGYWTTSTTLDFQETGVDSISVQRFPPGGYTLFASDAWGDVAVAYLQVV